MGVLRSWRHIILNPFTGPIPNPAIGAKEAHHFLGLVDVSKWSKRQWQDFWGDYRAQLIPQVPGAEQAIGIAGTFWATRAWQEIAVGVKGIAEVVRWPLYHYRSYAAAGSTQISLFDQTEGSATNGRADTNMRVANQMPGGEMMAVSSFRMKGIPAQADVTGTPTAFEEWYNVFLTNCWFEFAVSDKEYLVAAPLTLLPEGAGIVANLGGVTTASYFQNGSPDNRAVYELNPPIGIPPTIPFRGFINWRAVQAVTAAGRIGTVADGHKLRLVM